MKQVNKIALILLSLVMLGFTSFTENKNEWVLKKRSDGVTVYNRSIENSDLKEIKAVTEIQSSLSSIIALLSDRESFPKWVYKCEKAYTIKTLDETEAFCYQNVVAPWPVDNRDIVINVKVTQDTNTLVVYQKATSNPRLIPFEEDHVRIEKFYATWKLTPLKNGKVHCEYQLQFDPGGSIPAWLINMASTDGPFETTYNMRSIVFEDKYQKANLPYLTEPKL